MKLLGVNAEQAQHVAGRAISFHGWSLGWILFFGILLGALVVWMYRRAGEHLSPVRRYTLAGLRALFLLLILLLLARPILAFTIEQTIRKSLVLLIDSSKSMNIEDPRTDMADRIRVGIARGELDPSKGLDQKLDGKQNNAFAKVARVEVLKAVLKNQKLDLLPKLAREYDLSVYTFDRSAADVNVGINRTAPMDEKPGEEAVDLSSWRTGKWIDALADKGLVTAIGDSVADVTNKKRGQPLAGVLIMTDGGNNSGADPLQAANQAKRDGFAIHTYGVGIASPRDIIVGGIFAPEIAFTRDEVPVNVRVRSQNLPGESAMLVLKLVNGQAELKVDEKKIEFGGDSEQVIAMKFTPPEKGEFTLKAEIAPRDDETVKDNNSATQGIKVVDDKIKVLLIEQTPRWEYKYLSAMLSRDRRVEYHALLFEGDKNLARSPNSPYLEEFPAKDEDLFKFDLIILGDVDPKLFAENQIKAMQRFVNEFSGAMVFLSGRRSNPNAYKGTLLEKMLPVDLVPGATDSAPAAGAGVADRPIKLKVTAAGRSNAMLRISDKEQESMELWSKLPPVYWTTRVLRAKPGADVLMVDPDDTRKYHNEEMPIMAMQQYGRGQTLFLGTDNTWRWRKNAGDKYYTTLWGQITYRMALPHLLGDSKTAQLKTNKEKYSAGERVTAYARLYTPTFQPWTSADHPVVKGVFKKVGEPAGQLGAVREFQLKPKPDSPGMYSGEFTVTEAGAYEFRIAEREKDGKWGFEVVEPLNEYGDTTAMNEQLLKEMSAASGGQFFREEDLYKLPESLGKGTDHRYTKFEIELGSTWIFFALLMGVVTAEWILRKASQLK